MDNKQFWLLIKINLNDGSQRGNLS